MFFICSPSCMMPIHSIATPDVCRLFQFLCHHFKTNCHIYVFVISKNTSVQHNVCFIIFHSAAVDDNHSLRSVGHALSDSTNNFNLVFVLTVSSYAVTYSAILLHALLSCLLHTAPSTSYMVICTCHLVSPCTCRCVSYPRSFTSRSIPAMPTLCLH